MTKVVLAVAVCICMVAVISQHHAAGAADCQQVLTQMQSCENYLKSGGSVSADCCKGVRTLNNAATTAAKKRQFCECLKSEAKSLGVKSQYATSLPKKCSLNLNYPISYKFNCSSIQ